MTNRVVVLSASGDPGQALRLADHLASLGIGTWLAVRDMDVSRDQEKQTFEAMKAAGGAAILLDAPNLSFGAQQDIRHASDLRLPILALREDGAATLPEATATLDLAIATKDVILAFLSAVKRAPAPVAYPNPIEATPEATALPASSVETPIPEPSEAEPAQPAVSEEVAPIVEESPEVTTTTAPPTAVGLGSFIDSDALGKWAVALIAVSTVVMLFSFFHDKAALGAVGEGNSPQFVFEANKAAQFRLASIGSMLIAAVPFLAWFHRAYANMLALGNKDLKYDAANATALFVVPFAQALLPGMVMQTLWKGTAPESVGDPYGWRKSRRSGLVLFWAITWILPGYFANISFQEMIQVNDPDYRGDRLSDLKFVYFLLSTSSVLQALAGTALIAIIFKVIARQRARYEASALALEATAPAQRVPGSWTVPVVVAAALLVVACVMNGGSPPEPDPSPGMSWLGSTGTSGTTGSVTDPSTTASTSADASATGGSVSDTSGSTSSTGMTSDTTGSSSTTGTNSDTTGTTGSTASTADNWQLFSYPDHGFSVEMAGEIQPPRSQLDPSVFVIDTKSDSAYFTMVSIHQTADVGVEEVGDALDTRMKTDIGTALSGVGKATTIPLIASIGPLTGYEVIFTPTKPELPISWTFGTIFVAAKGNYFYRLVFYSAPGPSGDKALERFVKSFQPVS